MYLALSILFSSLINVVFRYFPKYDIDNQQAITFNYWVCVLTGYFTSDLSINQGLTYYQIPWAQYTLLLGFAFIIVFYGMAITAQKHGISVSVIASKMGVVFPVLFAYFFLNDQLNALLIIGILLSLVSVYFVSLKPVSGESKRKRNLGLLLPFLVLLGSGFIDTSLKVIEINLHGVDASVPTILIFFSAAIIGSLVATYRVTTAKTNLNKSNLLAGIALGIPNYFSIYFLFKALQEGFFTTSQVYPLNNIGVVLGSTLLSILLFREHLNTKNILGIILAVVAILLIGFAN